MIFYLHLCLCGSHPATTLFWGPRPSLLQPWLLAFFGLVDYDAFKQSVSDTNCTLSVIDTPTSSSNAPIPWIILVISYVSWCFAVCNWNKVASLHSSTVATLFSTLTATLDTGARVGIAGIDGVSVLHLTDNTDSHESHKPKCVDSWDQIRIRSYFASVTF
jgi:hypothetical protein